MPKRASCLLICVLSITVGACRRDVSEKASADVPIPSGASAVFYEAQSWESGGGSTRLTLRADGTSELRVKTEGSTRAAVRTEVVPAAHAKAAYEAALRSGIHVLQPVRPTYTDGAGVRLGAIIDGREVAASIATTVEPEGADVNWRRYQEVAAVFGPLLVAATSELALVAHWDEIVGPTRGPDVTFENRSDRGLVVLPNLLRFELEGVPFVPFPGPPIDPGGRAFLLAPGERRRVPPLSDGVWRPSPGEHVGRGRYVVTEELARHAAIAGTPWIGALDVPPGTITVPAPSTSAGPSPLAAPPP